MNEIIEFSKNKAQTKAVERITKSKAQNIMLFGGARASKTFLAVYILIVRACKCRSSHIIVRNTFNSVKNSIWMGTLPTVLRLAFPDLSYSWDKTNYILNICNGSSIRCAGLDDGDKLERLLGLEFSSILVEECNQVPWNAVQKLKTRLAERNILSKKVYYTQNPTTTTSAYYQAFEQGIDPIDGEAFDDEAMADYLSIKMSPRDNVQNLDEEFIKMLEKLPAKERKRFLDGDYDDSNNGAAVYAFNREEHVTDKALKQDGTIFVGSDFNFQWNSDVLCSKTAHNLYVWDEIQVEGDTWKKCNELKKKGATGAIITCDSTGKARRTSGISDHQILKDNHFQLSYKTNPLVIDKINNLNRCFAMGIIKINPKCKKLVRDLTQTVWDKHGQLDQKTDPSLTHLVDSLAYLCWNYYPMIEKKKSRRLM